MWEAADPASRGGTRAADPIEKETGDGAPRDNPVAPLRISVTTPFPSQTFQGLAADAGYHLREGDPLPDRFPDSMQSDPRDDGVWFDRCMPVDSRGDLRATLLTGAAILGFRPSADPGGLSRINGFRVIIAGMNPCGTGVDRVFAGESSQRLVARQGLGSDIHGCRRVPSLLTVPMPPNSIKKTNDG